MNDRVRVLPVPLPEFSGTGIPAGNTRTGLYPLPDSAKKSGTQQLAADVFLTDLKKIIPLAETHNLTKLRTPHGFTTTLY